MKSSIEAFDSGGEYYSNAAYDFEYAFRPLRAYAPFVEMFVKPED